jgi:hypothetical protein
MNQSNISKYGAQADYELAFRTRPASIMIGTLLSAAIYAAGLTALAGFLF